MVREPLFLSVVPLVAHVDTRLIVADLSFANALVDVCRQIERLVGLERIERNGQTNHALRYPVERLAIGNELAALGGSANVCRRSGRKLGPFTFFARELGEARLLAVAHEL